MDDYNPTATIEAAKARNCAGLYPGSRALHSYEKELSYKDEENQNLLGKIDRLNKQRLVTVARLENQSRNLKVVREAVGECREGGNKLAAALIESMQHDIEILEHELRNFS